MRWYIIRTLIHKEFLRHLSNRGGLALAILLIGMAAMLAAFGRSTSAQASFGLLRGVNHCYVDYWDECGWVDYLKAHVPEAQRSSIHFRNMRQEYAGRADEVISYPTGVGAIQMRPAERPDGPLQVMCWYPGEDRGVMGPYESWFWRASREYFRAEIAKALDQVQPSTGNAVTLPPMPPDDVWIWQESHERFLQQVSALKAKLPADAARLIQVPELEISRQTLKVQAVGTQTTISAALVLFALFFICVYMLPSLACEERENGVLLAQALSPASPLEIITAKLLFYPVVAIVFAAMLGGLAKPHVLLMPFFWLTLLVLAFGSLGIGMTISCAARTQRAASMTALCYMLVVSLTILICQQNNVWFLPQFFVEFHGPRMLNAAISHEVTGSDYKELLITAGLAVFWNAAATISFRRFGWQ